MNTDEICDDLRSSIDRITPKIQSQSLASHGVTYRSNVYKRAKYILELSILTSETSLELSERLRSNSAFAAFNDFFQTELNFLDPTKRELGFGAEQIELVAIPIMLGETALANAYCQNFLSFSKRTNLWEDFSRALVCLLQDESYLPLTYKKLSGLENHWLKYLQLISALTNRTETNEIISDIEKSFTQYNSDKRIWNFGVFDPSGNAKRPTDHRLSYILAAAANRRAS